MHPKCWTRKSVTILRGVFFMVKYSNELKLEVIKYAKKYGVSDASQKYKVAITTIYRWQSKYEKYGISGFSRKPTEKYSLEDKLKIIEYYRKHGKMATIRTYDICDSVFMNWERKLLVYGENELLKDNRGRPKNDQSKCELSENEDLLDEVQRLRLENAYLKKLDALVQKRERKQRKKK